MSENPEQSTPAKSSSHPKGHGRGTLYLIAGILLATVTAVVLVWVLPEPESPGQIHPAVPIFEAIEIGGEVFLRALMMVVIPPPIVLIEPGGAMKIWLHALILPSE